jgi:hypothetical protein
MAHNPIKPQDFVPETSSPQSPGLPSIALDAPLLRCGLSADAEGEVLQAAWDGSGPVGWVKYVEL